MRAGAEAGASEGQGTGMGAEEVRDAEAGQVTSAEGSSWSEMPRSSVTTSEPRPDSTGIGGPDAAAYPPALPFFVIAIGASAGGLEALQELFRHVDPHAGVSYVVIQHLSPDFKSMMAELLGRHTRLSVVEIRDGTRPVPECIHVIAPNHVVTLEAGFFRMVDRTAARGASPVNVFLESLALTQGDQCAAIILSGTGIDGTHGARLVKEVGGLVMAQDPSTAKFDGMPSNVIGSGSVDFVGSPRLLAERLQRYLRDAQSHTRQSRGEPSAEREAFDEIMGLLRQQSRINFSMYKPGMVMRRIRRRAALAGEETLESYVAELRNKPAEIEQLTRELLIGVTQFFRDPDAWAHLAETTIPQVMAAAEERGTLRLWVAGCATGEEAYSLGILLEEHASRVGRPVSYRIFATDVRRDSLRYARAGVYPTGACLGIPDALRDKYFEPRNDHWVAKPSLRDAVTFAPHDLLSDAPFTQISLVVCRNTLIYLTAEARRQVLSRLRLSLREGGFLFLGPSEVASDALAQFRPLDERGSVLVARGSVVGGAVISVMKDLAPEVPGAVSPPQRSVRTTEALYEAAVQRYAPPGVAVDSNFELLQVFGRVADFVSVPPGRVTVSLLKMVPRSLAAVLGTAGRKALRNGEEVVIPEVRVTVAGVEQVCTVRIVPVDDLPGVTLGLMIFFEAPEQPKQSRPQIDLTQLDQVAQHRLKELEDELVLARESASAALADLESSNQELEAANDDLTASSEALESTNEELQSVNEALYTVNSECKRKIETLEEMNSDLENLLRVVDVGVLLLDESLMIRRFNNGATRLFPLRPEDVGRPLTEIALQADYPGFARDVREVLSLGIRKAASVLALDGAWWSIGVRTARDSSSRMAGGVIVTMHEISELRRAISELSRLKQVHEIAEGASGIGHAVLDLAQEVVHFSEGARRLLGFSEGVMSVSLERSLALFGIAADEEQGLALDALRDGRGLPASFEAELRVLEDHPVRLSVKVFAKTEASTGSRLVFALLTRP